MDAYAADHKMDWLVWLQRIDPDCPHTAAALTKLKEEFPELSIEREIDLDAPRSEVRWVERESPWTADDLLARPAKSWLLRLLNFQGDDPFGPSLAKLLDQAQEAATQRFDWGIELADALVEGRHWDAVLWPPLLKAWQTELGEAEYREVLSRLRIPELQRHHVRAASQVLAKLVGGGGRPFAREVLGAVNELASSLSVHVRQDASTADGFDWYTLAINRAAGPLAEFWLGSLSVAVRKELVARGPLEEPYRSALDAIVGDQSPSALMARAVLMRGFAFLLNLDEDWTRERLAPSLIEPPDSEEFQAAWDGLMYGSLDVSTVDALTEPFGFAAAHVQAFRDRHTREQFIDYLVSLLIDFVDDPIGDWIPRFLVNAGDDDRQRFAWAIWRRLSEMSDADTQELWRRWLRRYWDNRLNGVPTPLQTFEIEWMQNWLLELGSMFAEAVKLAVRMPLSGNDPWFLIEGLKQGEQCERAPDAAADLLIRMAESESVTVALSDWEGLIDRLLQSGLTEGRSESLRDLRARLGLS